MEKKNSNRTCRIQLFFTPEEYAKLEQNWTATACRTRGNYLRNHLLEKPIIVNLRDQSIDEYMSTIIGLRGELRTLSNGFNQIVMKLDSLQQIRESIVWLIAAKLDKEKLLVKVEEIKNHIQKMAEKWLQS
jgi:hypothetical protein